MKKPHEVNHVNGCELGDNWKDCPACQESSGTFPRLRIIQKSKSPAIKPKIVPFRHKVAYLDDDNKTFYQTHDHFKIMYGRRCAGVFWSKQQVEQWLETYSSEKEIKRWFKLRIAASKREVRIRQQSMRSDMMSEKFNLRRLAWLEGRTNRKPKVR